MQHKAIAKNSFETEERSGNGFDCYNFNNL